MVWCGICRFVLCDPVLDRLTGEVCKGGRESYFLSLRAGVRVTRVKTKFQTHYTARVFGSL